MAVVLATGIRIGATKSPEAGGRAGNRLLVAAMSARANVAGKSRQRVSAKRAFAEIDIINSYRRDIKKYLANRGLGICMYVCDKG